MRQTKTILFFLIIVFQVLQSCRHKKQSLIDEITFPKEIMNEPDSLRNIRDLNNLVYNISVLKTVEGPYLGIEARRSTQPNYAHLLAMYADTNQLLKLTDHAYATVKLFAFEALQEKKYSGLKEIFLKHLYDDQTYMFHSGCSSQEVSLNTSLFNDVYPLLTKSEIALYQKELAVYFYRYLRF